MELKLRLNEVIMMANIKGKNIKKKDIAERLYPGMPRQTQQVNMSNLISGRTKRVTPEMVDIICEMCECTPNDLFGFEKTRK